MVYVRRCVVWWHTPPYRCQPRSANEPNDPHLGGEVAQRGELAAAEPLPVVRIHQRCGCLPCV